LWPSGNGEASFCFSVLRVSIVMVACAFRRSAFSLLSLFILATIALTAMTDEAEARRRKRGGYAPPYASIVVDVNTGKVLQGTNADEPRFPASVTKVMTLYMLFEQMERGKFQPDTPLKVSAFAARQAPSKISFDPGETIEVDDAIRALVTKSANDVAVVVAEAIGGDQETFAEMMTEKARSIGMKSTTFKNASGLPNREQVTTARDLATLGRAIHERFPKYWRYFQTRNFEYAGRNYRNHNRLLGRVDGVDGIKTGYTRASGFNLLTSARDGNRHLMAVVLGGRSGRIRDAQMASLVENHLPRAYAGLRTAPRIVEASAETPAQVAALVPTSSNQKPETRQLAQPDTKIVTLKAQPEKVAEIKAPAAKVAEIKPAAAPAPVDYEQQRVANIRRAIASARTETAPTKTVPSTIVAAAPVAAPAAAPAKPAIIAAAPAKAPAAAPAAGPVAAFAPTQQQANGPQMRWNNGAKSVEKPNAAPGRRISSVAQADPITTASTPKTASADAAKGFVIQLGAADDETKARAILDKAKAKNRTILADASAFTEKVQKGDTTLFRARFSGFDDNKEANAACGALKKSGFNCFVQRI
jgi:D-alanyl-D-alanine carboxypeptidase